MFLSSLFSPVNLIVLLAIALSLIASQQKQRRRLMVVKCAGDSLYATYLIVQGGFSGAASSFIAATGGFIQAVTPDEKLHATLKLRFALAMTLSVIAVFLTVHTFLDLLPLLAMIFCRFSELQKDPQRVRTGFFLSIFPWLYYNYVNGFYLLMIYNIIFGIALGIAVLRHRDSLKLEKLQDPV